MSGSKIETEIDEEDLRRYQNLEEEEKDPGNDETKGSAHPIKL